MSERVGLYPGSFDPVTFGHIDLIRRSLQVVDRLVVAILPNATKEALLSLAEREALLRSVVGSELAEAADRVEIRAASNLTVRIAEEAAAHVIIRGFAPGQISRLNCGWRMQTACLRLPLRRSSS